MIITISGKTASGKDTIGKLLAEKTGFKLLSFSFKQFLKDQNIVDFEKNLDLNFDKKFDNYIKNEVLKLRDKNLIVISRLSAINLRDVADLKIFLFAEFDERAKRLAKREGIPLEKAKILLKERDEIFENRIKKIYGIDYSDPKYYDLIINTTYRSPEEIVSWLVSLIG